MCRFAEVLCRILVSVKHMTLRRINNALSLVVIALCLYIVLAPFWPKVEFELKDDPPLVQEDKIPDQNTLVIPKMKLQETIHEGSDSSALKQGIWHRPHSSIPANSGNTVVTGHRFTYGGPAVLYHLDKVEKGDDITVYWNKKRYDYRVESIQTVQPWQSEIEDQTEDSILTIYTCTPLVTARQRLVVQAELVEHDS